MNTREREVYLKGVARIDELHTMLKSAQLKDDCVKLAMDLVASGDMAPFNSHDELIKAAEDIANKDPRVIKQAMAIVKSQRVPSLGKIVNDNESGTDNSGLDEAEKRFIEGLRNLGGL